MQEARSRSESRSWARIPERIFALDLREGATLAYLMLFNEDLAGRAGTVKTSCAELGARLGKSERSGRRAIDGMVAGGVAELVASERGRVVLYLVDADEIGDVRAGPAPREEPLFDGIESGGSAAVPPKSGGSAGGTAAVPPKRDGGEADGDRRKSPSEQELRIVDEESGEPARDVLRRLPSTSYTSYTSSTSPSDEGEDPSPVGDVLDGVVEREADPLSYASPSELAHFARALQAEFLAAGDKRMSLGICNRVARAVATGRFPRAELRRIFERAAKAANCGSYFVKAFKNKCRELGIDFESLSPERPQ